MLLMRDSKHKTLLIIVFSVVLIGGIVVFGLHPKEKEEPHTADYKNAAYVIDGQQVQLKDGASDVEATPGSASKITTRYFGNELKTDLNNDGREDVVFLLTRETGGSGTFFYPVAALNTDQGWIGSDGYPLGDRIAPQTINESTNPNQKNVIVVNYADRKPGEPMTVQPSVSKSVFLKLDPTTMQWGVVVQNFEGESVNGIAGVAMLGPTCPVMKNPPDPQCADKPYKTSLVVTTADQARVIKTFSTGANGAFRVELPAGIYAIRSAAAANILPRCASNGTITVKSGSFTNTTVYCDTGIR